MFEEHVLFDVCLCVYHILDENKGHHRGRCHLSICAILLIVSLHYVCRIWWIFFNCFISVPVFVLCIQFLWSIPSKITSVKLTPIQFWIKTIFTPKAHCIRNISVLCVRIRILMSLKLSFQSKEQKQSSVISALSWF